MGTKFFWKWMLVATALVGGTNALLGSMGADAWLVKFTWESLAFFFVVTLLLFVLALNGVRNRSHSSFMGTVFGAMAIKFIICIVAVIVYLKVIKPDSIIFILPFFVMYVIFTVIETASLVRAIKQAEGDSNTTTSG
jgi:hypothetical protein